MSFAVDVVPAEIVNAHDQITLGIIGLLGLVVTALVYVVKAYANTKVAAEQSTKANEAVNNVGPGEHRLYDIIAAIQEKQATFDRAWGNLPEDMHDAVGLTELLNSMERRIENIETILTGGISTAPAPHRQPGGHPHGR